MDGRSGLLDLFSRWDLVETPIPLGELRRELGRLKLTLEDVADCATFTETCYQRVLIHRGATYEALILCWRSGQRSPIHDHAGSSCAVSIIAGTATETVFVPSPCGRLVPARSRSAGAGALYVSHDTDIHQMANLQPEGQDLISLHIYTPPLAVSRIYSIDDTTLAGHDFLRTSRPQTISAEIRIDGPHGLSRNHPARVNQVTT